MRCRKFVINPVEQQPFGLSQLNEKLKGATQVETYTKPEPTCGEDRTLVVIAFYPDDEAQAVHKAMTDEK